MATPRNTHPTLMHDPYARPRYIPNHPAPRSQARRQQTPRRLTIEEYWTPDQRPHHAAKAMLRLKGAWLQAAGFTPGTPVTVILEHGELIITKGRP